MICVFDRGCDDGVSMVLKGRKVGFKVLDQPEVRLIVWAYLGQV